MHLVYPPKFCITDCFQFLLGITLVPREIEDNGYAKFWEVNKVRAWSTENGDSGVSIRTDGRLNASATLLIEVSYIFLEGRSN